jgi:menaquinone-specific isochorismate synthase
VTDVPHSDGRHSDGQYSDGRHSDTTLERGLLSASRTTAITRIGFAAPVASAAAFVAALEGEPAVAWASRELVLAGLGAARELRSEGDERWARIVSGARSVVVGPDVGEIRSAPRFLGGLAFLPGAAAHGPWRGFGDAWFVLPRWTYTHDGKRGELVLAIDAREVAQAVRWRTELARIQRALSEPVTAHARFPRPATCAVERDDRATWRAQIDAITAAIARGECEKIVAARSVTVQLSGDVRPADLLADLDVRHPDCVRLFVRPPDGGTLVAATPERLVRVTGRAVACDALAGSRQRDQGATDAAVLLASDKDRREHAIVVDAIVAALHELGADVSAADQPRVRALRHVLHLHTPIAAILPAARHVLDVAERLHPTPAVGGTPARFAREWIAAHERARGWYASPVGWFDGAGNGDLAVALRCGVIEGSRAHLWAGAGIVAGSDPDRELAETELKLRPMLGALGGEP